MKVYFIVNPKSGKGLKIFRKFQKDLKIPHKIYLTEYPKHATELTLKIKAQAPDSLVVAVGGDGTINEIINGALGSELSIGVIRSGSGNDFSRHFYHFETAADITRFIKDRSTGEADIGQVRSEGFSQFFINSSGIGFDALICERVSRSKFKHVLNKVNLGKLVYVYYVLLELYHFKPFQLNIQSKHGIKRTYEQVWFVAVNNQPFFGGGMKISPNSNTEDGKFEYTIIHRIGKLRFLMIFWKVFKGSHLKYQQYVTQIQDQSCQIWADKPLFGHVDGEYFTVDAEKRLGFSVSEFKLKYASIKQVNAKSN